MIGLDFDGVYRSWPSESPLSVILDDDFVAGKRVDPCECLAVINYTAVLSITLDLSAETIARLSAEAVRRGISVELLIDELALGLPHQSRNGKKLRLVGLGASSSGRRATEADDMLAEGL